MIDQLRKKHKEDVNQLKLNYQLATHLNCSEIDLVWTQITSQAMMNGHQKSKAYIPEVLEEKDVKKVLHTGAKFICQHLAPP